MTSDQIINSQPTVKYLNKTNLIIDIIFSEQANIDSAVFKYAWSPQKSICVIKLIVMIIASAEAYAVKKATFLQFSQYHFVPKYSDAHPWANSADKGWSDDHPSRATTYRIWSNYRIYPYKHTLMKFRSLITASVLFIYFFIKAYVVGSHLNCIDLSMQFKWVPTTYAFIKKIRKKNRIIIIK